MSKTISYKINEVKKQMATPKNNLTILHAFIEAKELEAQATTRRVELEQEVFEAFESELAKPEGLETIKQFGFKITINRAMTWKLDEEKYRVLAESLPDFLHFHRTKLELDKIKYYSILAMSETSNVKKYIKKIQDCVSVKPAKIAVKVEEIKC